MDKKIITLLIILLFAAGMAYAADNNTADEDLEDAINYIVPVSFDENGIEFDDGFIGFSLADDDVTVDDEFTQAPTDNDELQNYIKLAIIECYKQSREDDIGKIVASFCDGSYKSSDDEVITAVLDSGDEIGDNAVVELDNGSKTTFDFELLKSTDDKSDCIAYKVSIDESAKDDSSVETADNNGLAESDDDKLAAYGSADDSDLKDSDDATQDSEATASGNDDNNNTEVNETNQTVVNKTNTVIIHEQNTTVITKTVKNDTPQDTILKTAGNPFFILVIVAAIIAIVIFERYRRGD